MDSVFEGSNEVTNPGAREAFWTTDVSAFYNVHENLLLMANLPIRKTELDGHLHVHQDGDAELHPDHGRDKGPGDISLLARYTFLRHHTLDSSLLLALTAGVKFPTGATSARTDDGDEFLDAHTQLGTGSTDLLLGFSFNYALARVSVSGNALASFTGCGEAGDMKHKFGNSVNYDVTTRYRVSPARMGASSLAFFASIGIAGEARGRETEDGSKLIDSGGHTMYLTPGLQLNIGPKWVAELTYYHAIYHDLNAIQLGEDYKAFGSLTYLF